MTGPDIFCMMCKTIFDGFEGYTAHLDPQEDISTDEDE